MSAVDRVFLGWDQPLVRLAVQRLWVDFPPDRRWDLSNITLVLPVARAAFRLRQLLEERAQSAGKSLRPPHLLTIGGVPELLYQARLPLATDMACTMAWTHVLVKQTDETLAPLMPTVPPRDSIAGWVDMAQLLRRLCNDLAADSLGPADVANEVTLTADQRRWNLIAQLHQQYLSTLADSGLADPQEERRVALASGRCRLNRDIVLVGCVDFGQRIREMLLTVASKVHVYVGAPQSHSKLFDSTGRVDPTAWNDAEIQLELDALLSCGDSEHQAAVCASQLATWHQKNPQARFTVGITDDGFSAPVMTELELYHFNPQRSVGIPLTRTPPGRLLVLVGNYLSTHTWDAFAALVRHADVTHWLTQNSSSFDLLNELDLLRSQHLPFRVNDWWMERGATEQTSEAKYPFPHVMAALRAIEDWLQPLAGEQQSLSQWSDRLRSILTQIYPVPAITDADHPLFEDDPVEDLSTELSQTSEISQTAERIDRLLRRFSSLPQSLDVEIGINAAIDMLLRGMTEPAPPAENPGTNTVEVLGWLDLTLDDSDGMIVVGLNHPFVPQAVTADPFLPGTLRSRLHVSDNERRFARDAYILMSLASSRPHRAFVVGRFGPDAAPTPPSRLLAACPPETTVKRIQHLLSAPLAGIHAEVPYAWHTTRDKTDFPLPTADAHASISTVSVTAFRDYLTCPFRFYLRHILGLRPIDDSAAELAANQFGDLVHAAVEGFGQSDDKDLTSLEKIEASVFEHLHAYARRMYGPAPIAAVRLQIAQAEKRLQLFAQKQSERRREGWQIHVAEAAVREQDNATIQLADGRVLKLKGRVDRIDYHPEKDRWAILDYKTHGHLPLAKHYEERERRWIDLQLPLYLYMLAALDIHAPKEHVQLGYFNLAEKEAETGVHIADFGPQLIADAERTAEEVAARILDGDFSPELNPLLVPYDDYAMIMRTGIAENLLVDTEDGE